MDGWMEGYTEAEDGVYFPNSLTLQLTFHSQIKYNSIEISEIQLEFSEIKF